MSLTALQIADFNGMCPVAKKHGLGTIVDGIIDVGLGNIYYLDPTNGLDTNDGRTPGTAVKTLPVAYALLTANQNDVLVYIANAGSISLSAAFAWEKSYTHFVGLCSPVGVGGRARIFQTSTATGVSPLINITASGCIFQNLYIFHGVNDATSLVCVQVTGQRNYFNNVHFAGIGNATMDATGACSLKIDGGAENVFENCFIGLDTIARGTNSTELWFDSAATRNRFKDCMIYAYISNAGHALVTVEDAQGIDRYLTFENCLFLTDSENQAVTITSVFDIKAAIVQGKILLDGNCRLVTDGASGSGAWDSNTRGIIFSAAVAPAATAGGGKSTKV